MKKDYFGLGRLASLVLAIIPFTAWILGALTRIKEGKVVAGLIRVFFGAGIWVIDLIWMILFKKIFRILPL